jgi:hypothetical protein
VTVFTLIDEGRETSVDADVRDGRVLIEADDVEAATGWAYKPDGLCRGEICVPVRKAEIDSKGRIDLVVLAEALRQPLALDIAESAAFLGTSASDRSDQLRSRHAPDFRLPDLDGHLHSLSDYAGRKVLLIFYASW